METRANPKPKARASFSGRLKLEHLRNQALSKEAQLREQTEALTQERNSVEAERDALTRERETFARENVRCSKMKGKTLK